MRMVSILLLFRQSGTVGPNGLSGGNLQFLRRVFRERNVVGFDVVRY